MPAKLQDAHTLLLNKKDRERPVTLPHCAVPRCTAPERTLSSPSPSARRAPRWRTAPNLAWRVRRGARGGVVLALYLRSQIASSWLLCSCIASQLLYSNSSAAAGCQLEL